MKNELGDKCIADSFKITKEGRKLILFAEVDGMHFDSTEYPNKKTWLNAIVRRVYACAMGEADGNNLKTIIQTEILALLDETIDNEISAGEGLIAAEIASETLLAYKKGA